MPELIFNADDFGWTDGHNQAVEQAYCQGVLTSASLMATGEAFEQAVELTHRLDRLRTGLHLCLNESYSCLPGEVLPNLTNPVGSFYDEAAPLFILWLKGHLSMEEAASEWQAQIERALASGVTLQHLDSHKHVHMLPPLREAVLSLARQHKVPYIRLPAERFSGAVRRGPAGVMLWGLTNRARRRFQEEGVKFSRYFVGFGVSGAMTVNYLLHRLDQLEPVLGDIEVMLHPAVVTPAVANLQQRYRWAARYRFEEELAVLKDERVIARVQQLRNRAR